MAQTLANSNHTARALSLLGSGVSVESTAAALGVTPSAISQLLSDEDFAEEVIHLRYNNLQSHNRRDGKYDVLEDKLLEKLENALPLMFRPEMILKAISTVNNAKRRGQSAPQQVTESATVLNLTMPTKIVQKITTNVHNQVVSVGDNSLHTIPSSSLTKQLEAKYNEEKILPPEPAQGAGDTSEQQVEVAAQG